MRLSRSRSLSRTSSDPELSVKLDSGIYKPEESTPWTDDEKDMRMIIENHFGERLDSANLEDEVLLRFIRGYATESERVQVTIDRVDYLLKNLIELYRYQTILEEEEDAQIVEEQYEAWNVFIHGHDKWGHPVVYDNIVSCDLEKLENVFARDMDRIRPFRFRFFRRLQIAKHELSERYGEQIYKHILVFDFSKFSSAHMSGGFAGLIKAVIKEEQFLFPETSYKTFIINSPLAFRAAWAMVRAFIDPLTVTKISILGKNYRAKLQKYIDADQIPPRYGGTSEVEVSTLNPYY